jgi:hypothetical protein
MMETKQIRESLSRVVCYKCGKPLENSRFSTITSAPVALVAHVVCSECHAQSIVTLTTLGAGSVPLISDLRGSELKKFIGLKSVTYDEILDLHAALKKESIWNLLQKKEKSLEKVQKNSERKDRSQQ